MGKILYPVGTEVQIRDFKIKELADETGTILSSGKRVVIEYRKGESRPYVISTVDDHSRTASKRFAVGELKSYREAEVKNHPGETAETPRKSLSEADVAEIVREELAKAHPLEINEEHILINVPCGTEKEHNKMSAGETIRQKLIYASKSKQERLLQEQDILSNGYLTEQGRRVVLDLIWEGDKDLQKAVYEAVKKVTDSAKKGKKKNDEDEE